MLQGFVLQQHTNLTSQTLQDVQQQIRPLHMSETIREFACPQQGLKTIQSCGRRQETSTQTSHNTHRGMSVLATN